MTVGAGDALFDQDGTAAAADSAEGPAAAPAPPEPAPPKPAADAAAPGWLTGRPTLPWPPPAAAEEATSAAAASPPPRQPEAHPRPPVRPVIIPGAPPRPRIVEEPGILGLSRLTRGRFGSRLFTLFFVLVFTVIAVQMVVSILDPW
jgi:hypothetical protein